MSKIVVVSVRVWDPIVRVVHWSMILCVLTAWFVTDGRVHDAAGYVFLFLIALRIFWGFVGPQYARFASFVGAPRSVLRYAHRVWLGQEPRYVGHNPLGGWMIVALLVTGLATSLSGWLYTTDRFWGVIWVERTHVFLSYLLMVLAGAHVAGVVFTSIRQRENLIAAMFHGSKRPLEHVEANGSAPPHSPST